MQLKLDKRFWVVITCIIVVFTIFIVGRNLLHAIEIRKDIAILEQERAIYRARIEQDSTLLEELKYDDNLEQFARERYRMQRRGEFLEIRRCVIKRTAASLSGCGLNLYGSKFLSPLPSMPCIHSDIP